MSNKLIYVEGKDDLLSLIEYAKKDYDNSSDNTYILYVISYERFFQIYSEGIFNNDKLYDVAEKNAANIDVCYTNSAERSLLKHIDEYEIDEMYIFENRYNNNKFKFLESAIKVNLYK